jgi:hypothetical membrane protein
MLMTRLRLGRAADSPSLLASQFAVDRTVPAWTLLPAVSAPVLLIGGWTLAAALQPSGFDPVTQTISALSAYGATDRWVMTAVLYAVGVCHLLTSLGLRSAAIPGRTALACGGVASILVASLPEHRGATSVEHVACVVLGSLMMDLCPTLAVDSVERPWPLRPVPAAAATVLLVALSVWFLVEAHDNGLVGLAERVDAVAQSSWPLLIVATAVFLRLRLAPTR